MDPDLPYDVPQRKPGPRRGHAIYWQPYTDGNLPVDYTDEGLPPDMRAETILVGAVVLAGLAVIAVGYALVRAFG